MRDSEADPQSAASPRSAREASILNTVGSTLREFFVDFLGSLVPGFFFISLSIPLLLWLLWLFFNSMILHSGSPIASAGALQALNSFRIELVAAVLVFAYVLGSVFFRQDPKTPDQESAAHVLENVIDKNEVCRLVIQPPTREWNEIQQKVAKHEAGEKIFTKEQAKKWATGEGGQYPYSHLKQYLQQRGLGYLANYVRWDWTGQGDDETQKSQRNLRSKMFINVLKIRLYYCVPEKCSEIIRNEAHVRMMSSVWYACKALQKLYLWTLGAAVVPMAVILSAIRPSQLIYTYAIPWVMQAIALGLISFLPAKLLRVRIKKFIHYQRVREIVFVLETAWFAQQRGQANILDHLPGETS